MQGSLSYWLFGVAALFVVSLVARAVGATRRARGMEAWPRYRAALAAARARGDKAEKAAFYRDAARIALEDLELPGKATSLARRADRLAPEAPEGIALLSASMLAERRERALERLLWRKLSQEEAGSPRHERLFGALLALYEGPLKDGPRAEALRGMRPGG